MRPMLVEDNELVPLLGRIMSVRQRKELLDRMRKAIQIEETLKWGRIPADSL